MLIVINYKHHFHKQKPEINKRTVYNYIKVCVHAYTLFHNSDKA